MKLKVCGMRDHDQIRELLTEVQPDFMGFIFYAKSPRYVGKDFELKGIDMKHTKKVGVFVREEAERLIDIYHRLQLDYVQLHGDESLEYIKKLKGQGVSIIKVIRVGEHIDAGQIQPFEGYVDYFLFDTHVDSFGGEGKRFDLELLRGLKLQVPYLVAGGIRPENVDQFLVPNQNMAMGIDVNSGYENGPANKNIQELVKLKWRINEVFSK